MNNGDFEFQLMKSTVFLGIVPHNFWKVVTIHRFEISEMINTTAAFRTWLKGNSNMKLSSDISVLRLTHEGITSLDLLTDFNDKVIKLLPKVYKDNIDAIVADIPNGIAAENAVNGANISSISVQRLIATADAARYY